ncbi:neurogenic locus notch homolog protein 2-like isoform X2 [Hydractinia symbiolongicarpus]|uniref:neurogenic locus notch homolog protein 2-like isoform X2 n=1 Tax=Hydractinia symbiolongicarpus TaxID=13093 RepID=UPI00254CF007|nr:neurogenic locus notch homolog protein 2-like isoform X2 [Hydractinia symbiolongicarpus]
MEFIIQKQRRLLLMLTYFGFTYAEIYRNGNSFNATFSKVSNNKRLLSGLILSEKSPTIGHCLYKCVLTRTCKSINYYFELNNCELLSNEITDEDVTVESSNGWIHYQTEPSAEQVTPTIKSIVSTTKVTTATSNCAELSPCPHHTCQDTVSSYQCICKFGYTGETCETPPAPSLSSACKSVGDCAVVPGQAIACLSSGRCLCYVGWIGINNVYVRSTTSNYSTSVVAEGNCSMACSTHTRPNTCGSEYVFQNFCQDPSPEEQLATDGLLPSSYKRQCDPACSNTGTCSFFIPGGCECEYGWSGPNACYHDKLGTNKIIAVHCNVECAYSATSRNMACIQI